MTWADLADEPFIATARGSSLRSLTDTAFQQAQVTPQWLIETQAVGSAAGMVGAGLRRLRCHRARAPAHVLRRTGDPAGE